MGSEQFSRIVAVDFSASSVPKLGPDSIWVASAALSGPITTRNLATRRQLAQFLENLFERNDATLVVFDVALGWLSGLARSLGMRRNHRDEVVALLDALTTDNENNSNNRFDVANELNRRAGAALFWGHPHGRHYSHLSPTTIVNPGVSPRPFDARRTLERSLGGTIKSPMQLSGVGAVGSQSLLAQVLLHRCRQRGAEFSVWPFEQPTSSVVVGECFFSVDNWQRESGVVKDERQVRAVVRSLRTDVRNGRDVIGDDLLDGLSREVRRSVTSEEGWLVGWSSLGDSVTTTGQGA